jgi:hypothetical protein
VTRLRHPETGGEFDAPERSVPVWQRSGWTRVDQPPAAPAPGGKQQQADTSAGKSGE